MVVNFTKDKTKKHQLLNARVTQSNEKMAQSLWHTIGLLDFQCCLIPINTFFKMQSVKVHVILNFIKFTRELRSLHFKPILPTVIVACLQGYHPCQRLLQD